MGVYPKVKKLASGGQIADPVLGVGIQYQQRAADIPNLDAQAFQLEENRRNEDLLQQEREKKKISRQAALETISKYEGTPGQKKNFADMIMKSLDDYEAKSKSNNINWVFSEEASNQYADVLDQLLNPGAQEEMRNNALGLRTDYDALIKNNTQDLYQVDNGQALARDKETGAVSLVPYSQLDPNKYSIVTGKERYDELSNSANFNRSKDPIFTSMYNSDDAMKSLLSSFTTATGASSSTGLAYGSSSNSAALAAAKRQAKQSLSREAKNTLEGQFIKENGGVWNEAKFDQYLNGILDNEVVKRRRVEEQLIAPPKGSNPEAEDSIPEGVPTFQTLNTTVTLTNSEGGDKALKMHVQGKGVDPVDSNTVIPEMTVNGLVYSAGGEGGFWGGGVNFSAERNKNDFYGAPKPMNKTYKNVRHTSNMVVPVTTGRVLDKSDRLSKETIDNGLLVFKSDGTKSYDYGNGNILDGTPIERKTISFTDGLGEPQQEDIFVMRRTDGSYVEVKYMGAKMYAHDDDGTEETLIVPMEPRESIAAFGVNVSPFDYNENYFSANGKFPGDQSTAGQILIKKLAVMNPGLFKKFDARYSSALASGNVDPRLQEEINNALNSIRKDIENGTIRKTLSFAKPDFTKKNSFDRVR